MNEAISSINPFSGEVNGEIELFTPKQVTHALENAAHAFGSWKSSSFLTRSEVLVNASKYLLANKDRLARLITLEMGKVSAEAVAEIEKCAWVCTYYAEKGEDFLKDDELPVKEANAKISYAPLGVVLAIMPWNFPFWQVFRFAAPAIMAGNCGLLKHASNVPLCANAIEEVFTASDLPEGVFQNLPVQSSAVADIIADQRLKAVTLTGSEWAGSQVAMAAGKHLKKTVLELGGSDPFIVLEDADIVEAAEIAVKARMLNCGQSCIAAKRFIIVQNRYDQFVETFEEQLKSLTLGDPVKPGVHYGPMARKDLAADLDQQMTKSIAKGATQVFPEVHAGAMFPANMLLEVVPGMPAFDEELFGPVAAMIRAKDENEAIELANLTKFGLGASVWTTDVDRGQQVARKIDAGSVFINKMVVSHPGIPFGGIKMSGYGRELAHLGLREFVNHKSIVY